MNEFNFGENLRITRKVKGISQKAMAIGLGMSQPKYSRLEHKASIPDLDLLEKICMVLGEEPSLLLSGREIKDLIPKIAFEQHAKEIMNTTVGIVFYWLLVIPFINTAYDFGNGFCEGLQTSEEVKKVVRFMAGIAAIVFAYYWMKRVQKGRG